MSARPQMSKTQWIRYDKRERLLRKQTKKNEKRVLKLIREVDTYENRVVAALPRDVVDPVKISEYGIPCGKEGRPLVVYIGPDHPLHKLTYGQGWEFVHRLVARLTFGPIPRGHAVHHIDGNRYNNHPKNLRIQISRVRDKREACSGKGAAEVASADPRPRTILRKREA